jgi:hypothetical protein
VVKPVHIRRHDDAGRSHIGLILYGGGKFASFFCYSARYSCSFSCLKSDRLLVLVFAVPFFSLYST